MPEEPPINREEKLQHPNPQKGYDFWGAFCFLPVAIVCTFLAMLLVFTLNRLFPPGMAPSEYPERPILDVLAIIGAGLVGGVGGAIGGVVRRPKKAMTLGICVGFALTILLVIFMSSDIHSPGPPRWWLILEMSTWLALFGGVGGLLGTWIERNW
jgi:hypothetical protein